MMNRINPGTHVICERRIASTDALPSTYSTLENGRQKYSGNAPFARSGEIKPGPPKVHAPNATLPFRSQTENVASLNAIRENHLHAVRRYRALTAKFFDRFREIGIRAVGFQFQKSLIRAPLFVEIRVVRDSSLLQDQHFITGVLNITQ